MTILNFWRSFIAFLGLMQLAKCASLRLFCNDTNPLSTYEEQPLSKAEELLLSACYNISRANFFFAPGFTTTVDNPLTVALIEEAMEQKQFNVFLLNWEREAAALFTTNTSLDRTIIIPVSYVVSAVPQVFKVGKDWGEALIRMARQKLKLTDTYLIGHSLGAHMSGFAGKTVRLNNQTVKWIYGLDPAGPLFSPFLFPSLSAGDGEFVVCLHTDNGNYGTNYTGCSVDIMTNFVQFTLPDKTKRVQPGCPEGIFQTLSAEAICSHSRALELFIEALRSFGSLVASEAKTVWQWIRGHGNCSDRVYYGLNINQTKRGIYFMNTSATSPYGLGIAGSCP